MLLYVGIIYMGISVFVAIFTLLSWKIKEHERMNTPIGDLEYFDYSLKYSMGNYLFLPSVFLCEGYKLLCRTINQSNL